MWLLEILKLPMWLALVTGILFSLDGTVIWTPALSVRGLVAETRQIQMDYRVLWRKRDRRATLSRGEHLRGPGPLSQEKSAPTLSLTGFYCFSGSIIRRMALI